VLYYAKVESKKQLRDPKKRCQKNKKSIKAESSSTYYRCEFYDTRTENSER
jgi:hypothetical protein